MKSVYKAERRAPGNHEKNDETTPSGSRRKTQDHAAQNAQNKYYTCQRQR